MQRSALSLVTLNVLMVVAFMAGCTTGDSAPQARDNPPSVSIQRNIEGKIDAALAMVVNDPAAMERLRKNPSAGRSAIPFVIEETPDGRLLVPVFVESRDVSATAAAIRAAGGSVETTVASRLVARVPLNGIATLAGRDEVTRIESTSRSELKRR